MTSRNDSEPDLAARANHRWLTDGFLDMLFDNQPASVLDVGCGSGEIMKACHERGVEVVGLDQPGPRLSALQAEGSSAREGTAYDLPFPDRSMDWVTMRHIPHHLEDPARAFAEALRVARTGLLLAEPYFDSSLPSQRGAYLLDCWEKRQDRRGGMFHAEVLDLAMLLDHFPLEHEERFEIEACHFLRLQKRSIARFEANAAFRTADLPASHSEREALAELLQELEDLGLSWNGSLCVSLKGR